MDENEKKTVREAADRLIRRLNWLNLALQALLAFDILAFLAMLCAIGGCLVLGLRFINAGQWIEALVMALLVWLPPLAKVYYDKLSRHLGQKVKNEADLVLRSFVEERWHDIPG